MPPHNPTNASRMDMDRLASGHDAALDDLTGASRSRSCSITSCAACKTRRTLPDLAQRYVRPHFSEPRHPKFDKRMRFSTWLYAIATNLVRDRFRHRARHPQVSLDAENEATGESFRVSVSEQKTNTEGESVCRTQSGRKPSAKPWANCPKNFARRSYSPSTRNFLTPRSARF